jgi:Helix-turn-helix domain
LNHLAAARQRDTYLAPNLDLILDEVVSRVAELVVELLSNTRYVPVPSGAPHDLLSVREAALALRCKPQRIYDLRSSGRLPKTTEGGRAVVRRSDIDALVGDRWA